MLGTIVPVMVAISGVSFPAHPPCDVVALDALAEQVWEVGPDKTPWFLNLLAVGAVPSVSHVKTAGLGCSVLRLDFSS